MSASLVGSEMCIRDRFQVRMHGTIVHVPELLEHGTPENPKSLDQYSPISVSYTHLTLPTICSV
eukprot:8269734-Alexandrium_andersonii.AAC.1